MLRLPQCTVSGPPEQMGGSYGAQLREPIRGFVAQRLAAASVYLRERGISDRDAFLALGRACLAALEAWDRDAWLEHLATAEGAGIDAGELYTVGNMTDIRDILTLPGPTPADREGCSAVLLPPGSTAAGEVIAAQTWDLNPTDLEFVVAVQRRPSAGPRTWSITCAGCPSLIGINEHGLAVGTTNIKTRGSRVGVPYLSLLHRAIRCADVAEAGAVFEQAPRAAAHTYWAADFRGAKQWECTASSFVSRELDGQPIVQTNHCQVAAHQRSEGEPASPSSKARLAKLTALVSSGAQDVATLRAAFADRSDGIDSINRYAEDGQGTATDACIVALPAERAMWACRGSADRGEWVRLGFE
ncbi:MAG: hypothetical protein H0W72_13520 [Planctomycetes bacterium]|nr:hypothetical protein [Planctomycetota bacterium]